MADISTEFDNIAFQHDDNDVTVAPKTSTPPASPTTTPKTAEHDNPNNTEDSRTPQDLTSPEQQPSTRGDHVDVEKGQRRRAPRGKKKLRRLDSTLTETSEQLGVPVKGADDEPKSHVCMWVTLSAILAGMLIIIGLTIFYAEVLENRNKPVVRKASSFTGSVRVIGGPYSTYSPEMSDQNSVTFKYVTQTFQYQMDLVFGRSNFRSQYSRTTVYQLSEGSVIIKFTVTFHTVIGFEGLGSSAYDLVQVVKKALDADGRLGVFLLDTNSISITAVQPSIPVTTTLPPHPVVLGQCLPIKTTSTCVTQPYNMTSFPNHVGHVTVEAAETWAANLATYMDVIFHCYDLIKLFACAVAMPKCSHNTTVPYNIVPPCRKLCEESWERCSFGLPLLEPLVGKLWPDTLKCADFPDSLDSDVCVGGAQVRHMTPRKCQSHETTCKSDRSSCIASDWLCDGHVDCVDASDEQECSGCPQNQHKCRFGQCVNESAVCDGRPDCFDASDEKGCVSLSGDDNGRGVLHVTGSGEDGGEPLCAGAETWNDTLARSVCRQLGYRTSNVSWNLTKSSITEGPVLGDTRESTSNEFIQSKIHLKGSCSDKNNVFLQCGAKVCGKRPALPPTRERILGGTKARPGSWPWLVSLHGGSAHAFYCAGSIIDDQWILTTAHCLSKFNITVRSGVMRRDTYSPFLQTRVSLRLVQHPGYNSATMDNDIGLIQLNESLRFTDYVQPVCLPSAENNLLDDEPVTVIGWGKTSDGAYDYERVVGAVQMAIYPRQSCQSKLGVELPGTEVTASMICAGGVRDRDACSGDSGGPLLYHNTTSEHWTVEGIVSFGAGCGKRGIPAIYTNVRRHVTWIRNVISNTTNAS